MAILLHIDTALEIASVALSIDERCIDEKTNIIQNDHAAWLHTAIEELLKNNSYEPRDLDAIAVTIGPGSYTGLRVGLSTAKGLCYALQKPLLTLSSLELLASVVTIPKERAEASLNPSVLICPLIDARRMEVYYALYDQTLTQLVPPAALVLDQNSFAETLHGKKIIFCGNATEKFKKVCPHPHAQYSAQPAGAREMTPLAFKKYVKKEFADLAYSAPLYIKEFETRK